jgi:hypothetical protein
VNIFIAVYIPTSCGYVLYFWNQGVNHNFLVQYTTADRSPTQRTPFTVAGTAVLDACLSYMNLWPFGTPLFKESGISVNT